MERDKRRVTVPLDISRKTVPCWKRWIWICWKPSLRQGLFPCPKASERLRPVLTVGSGIAARGGAHPAVLMPEPAGGLANAGLADEQHLTWLVAFINAYRFVNQGRQPLLDVSHVDAVGAKLEGLAFESDTSKPISINPALEDIQPVATAGDAQTPLWPWLALITILLLVAERLVALRLKGGRTV